MAFSERCSFLFVFLLQLSCFDAVSFSAGLIHRYSPSSPFHDHSLTRFDIMKKTLRRSSTRQSSFTSSITTDGDGDYIMKIFLGSRKSSIWAVADTGSLLTWTQCAPCSRCYTQSASLFYPTNSTSYKIVSCSSQKCGNSEYSTCSSTSSSSPCTYEVTYGDNSYTSGVIAQDTLSFKSSTGYVSFSSFYFGCGGDNGGLFSPTESGIVGLGNSPISMISQLGITNISYCLPDMLSTVQSAISFGVGAVVSGPNVTSTPLNNNQFYYFTLLSFSVGSNIILNPSPRAQIMIDSGTTLTYLQPALAGGIANVLHEAISCPRAMAVEIDMGLPLCYNTTSSACRFSVPPVVAHFAGGNLTLPLPNTFLEVETGIHCLTITNNTGGPDTWGNTAQVNFNVVYDLVHGVLSFQYTNCS